MYKKDCKEGLKVVYRKGLSDEDTGVIVSKYGSIFTNSGWVWVRWSDERILIIEPEEIEHFDTEPRFTVAEINAMLDAVLEKESNLSAVDWWNTDREIANVGIHKFREYLKDKTTKSNLKAQALAKLTPEEIEALGIK